MAEETKQVRIWKKLDIELLAKKLSDKIGVEFTQTQAVSFAVQELLNKLDSLSDVDLEKG